MMYTLYSHTAFRVHVRVQLKKSNLVWPKSEEKQDKDDYTCQGPSDRLLREWSCDQLPKIAKNKNCNPAL